MWVSAKAVVRAMKYFLHIFGIPKTILSCQGSNVSFHLFVQVLRQLNIDHNQSTAYHAQSQGALKSFHQILKSVLNIYSMQMNADW